MSLVKSCGADVRSGRERGLSLIELMIALVLGLLLIGGMVTVFSGSKRTAMLNSTLTELQESARFALDSIVRDVRLAGFQGCSDGEAAAPQILATNAPTDDFRVTALTAASISATGDFEPAAPIGFAPPAQGEVGAPVPGTHAISAQFGSPETWRITKMTSLFAPVVLADGVTGADVGLVPGDVAMISDCQAADIFTVSAVNGGSIAHAGNVNRSGGNADPRLTALYGQAAGVDSLRARLMRLEANVYYIGDTQRSNGAGDPVLALYRMSLPYVSPPPDNTPNPPIEMVEGASNLQIRLGYPSLIPGGAHVFTDAGAAAPVGAFGPPDRVQLGLLMRSFDPVAQRDDTRVYELAGNRFSPAAADSVDTYRTDRRMRLAFNSTIDVRNR